MGMGNRTQAEMTIFITVAAFYFVEHSRDAKEIAKIVKTNVRTIYRWAESPKWHEVLNDLGYTGERNFRVRPKGRKPKKQ